jgi:hypothetical protein
MLLKGGFSEQEITDAKRYIEFGKDYNKPSPFTKIFEISKRLFEKINFFTHTNEKKKWVLALTIFANNLLFIILTVLILIILNFLTHWKTLHYTALVLLGLGLGVTNAMIISKITNKNSNRVISFVFSPFLAIVFIIVYYSMSRKFIEIFGGFEKVYATGFVSLMKGAMINPGVASFIFFLFFNLVLIIEFSKKGVKVKECFYYGLALIYSFLNKVLTQAMELVKI